MEQIYETENGLKDAYTSVAKNDTIQTYFTQKFVDALKDSDEIKNGANVTLDTFTKSVESRGDSGKCPVRRWIW